MEPVYYVSKEQPKSHNHGGSSQGYKELHSTRFKEKYAHLYSGLPITKTPLKSKLVYIHHNLLSASVPDVDNLSKPIVDAFTGVIYKDDKQIIQREAIRIKLEDLEIVTIEMSNMPESIATDLEEFIMNQENHILLFAVDEVNLTDIKIGEI